MPSEYNATSPIASVALSLQTVTSPGDMVAIESPAFYACLQVLERLKLKAVEIPVHPSEGMDLDILADTLARLPIKAIWVMSSYHNPLGASMSDEKKKAHLQNANQFLKKIDNGKI